MPRKRPSSPAKVKAEPTPDHEYVDPGVLQTELVPPEPTVGEFLGLPPLPTAPDPGIAVMADDISELVDPTVTPQAQVEDDYRPGDNEPPPPEREPLLAGEDGPEPEGSDAQRSELNRQRQSVYDAQRQRGGFRPRADAPRREKTAPDPGDPEFIPPGGVRYESRIQIVDAFRYPGNLNDAPAWIDRNWVGFGDYDAIRDIPEGPCLRVPSTANPNEVVLARVGDYVCRQSVLGSDGSAPVLRTEVWASDQFERLFVGVRRQAAIQGTHLPALGDMGRRRKPAA